MSEAVQLPHAYKGKRMYFFKDPAIDQLYGVVVALTAEMSVLRDRLETVERLLESKGSISRADIEEYRPDTKEEGERTEWRDSYIGRVFAAIGEEADAIRGE